MQTKYPPDDRVPGFVEKSEYETPEGTRIYNESGHRTDLWRWVQRLQLEFEGELIPYEWVADYVGVSRVAVMKRAKKGQITVFSYRIIEEVMTFTMQIKQKPSRTEYKYVPIQECIAWIFDQIDDPRALSKNEIINNRPKRVMGWWSDVK